jgi:DNA-binding MarR family transcriptional regulator
MTTVLEVEGEVKQRLLLFFLEKDRPVSFTQIWREGKIAQSSAAKFLKEFEEKSLVKKEANGSYVLTDEGRLCALFEKVKRGIENLALEKEDLIELERLLDRLPSVRSVSELIVELLRKNGPMHIKELAEEILKVKPTIGKALDQTVPAILERGMRGLNSKWVITEPYIYRLNPSYQPNARSRIRQLDGKLYVELTEQLRFLNIKEDDEVEIVVEDGKIVITSSSNP